MKKTILFFIENIKIQTFLFILTFTTISAQTSLEMFSGAGNPTGNGPVQSTTINLQNNTNNPTGNTVAAANNPVGVTYTLSNHAYSYTTGNPLGTGFMTNIGAATTGADLIYPLTNSIAAPLNSYYTAGTTTGQGIDVTVNRNVNFHTYVQPLANNGVNATTRVRVCNITLTFSRPVDNPILHITGMGAFSQNLGSGVMSTFSAEFNVLGGYSLTRLSGISTTGFVVENTNQINNNNTNFATSGAGSGSGSVLINGTDISTLTLEVYIDGANSNGSWNPNGGANAGETFTIGVSLPQNVLVATNDTFSGGTVGTSVTTASVLANDTFNGGTATTTNVTVSGTTVPVGFTVNADGTITKAASVAAGTYTITYQICDNAEAGNCKTATATITVTCPILTAPTLSSTTANVACPNTFNLNGLVTSSTPSGATLKWYTDTAHTTEVTTPTSITTGGTYYAFYTSGTCFSPASAAVTVTFHSPAAPTVSATTLTNVCPLRSVNLNSLITSTTPAGTTLVWYDKNNLGAGPLADPTNVSTSGTYVAKYNPTGTCNATDGPFWTPDVVVTITNCVDAIDGSQTVAVGATGTISVLANDTYNGGAAGSATLSNVNLTQQSTTNAGVTLNTSTGMIQVAAGTPAGTYTITYQICTKTTPVTCDTATETVTVGSLLDSDGDGISDDIDIDDDNDGILDTAEQYTCYTNATGSGAVNNVVSPAQSVSGSGVYRNSVNFFNWPTTNLVNGTSTSFIDIYGVTYTATISNLVKTGSKSTLNGFAMQTYAGNTAMAYRFYNPSTIKPNIVTDNNVAQTGTVKFDVTITAKKGTIDVPINAILFDGETTFNDGGATSNEITKFTSSGTPFTTLENFNGTPTVSNLTGLNTNVVQWINNETVATSAALQTQGYNLKLTIDLSQTNGPGIEAVAIGVRPYCDADSDGIPNFLDLDSDNDGCLDAIEGAGDVKASQLANSAGTVTVGVGSTASNQNLCGGTTCVNAQGLPQLLPTPPTGYSNTTGQGTGSAYDAAVNPCKCFKAGATGGTVLDTKHGITALGRAGANGNWPMIRKGAWTALEAKSKGFVVNRVAFSSGNPVGIPAANFVEGMLVYDTTNNCLKMYTSQDGGVTFGWYCISTQTCPDIL